MTRAQARAKLTRRREFGGSGVAGGVV